jgi:hypothetical protein
VKSRFRARPQPRRRRDPLASSIPAMVELVEPRRLLSADVATGSLAFTMQNASSGIMTGQLTGAISGYNPDNYYSIEVDDNADGAGDSWGYLTSGSATFEHAMTTRFGTHEVRVRVWESDPVAMTVNCPNMAVALEITWAHSNSCWRTRSIRNAPDFREPLRSAHADRR